MGPYKVLERFGHVAYLLDLSTSEKMQPVCHVLLVQPWRDDGCLQPPPPRSLCSRETVYTTEKILDHCTDKRKNLKHFLVRWEGYDPVNDLWKSEANMQDPTLINSREHCAASKAARVRLCVDVQYGNCTLKCTI